MHTFKLILASVLAILAATKVSAQNIVERNDSVYDIIDDINESATIIVIQPDGMQTRMRSDSDAKYGDGAAKTKVMDRGDEYTRYSVQIFSENKGSSSKTNAEYRKRLVEQRMPGMHASMVYDSPYWRVRVGSFRTQAEAKAAERELKSKFPSFAGEMRIVRLKVK